MEQQSQLNASKCYRKQRIPSLPAPIDLYVCVRRYTSPGAKLSVLRSVKCTHFLSRSRLFRLPASDLQSAYNRYKPIPIEASTIIRRARVPLFCYCDAEVNTDESSVYSSARSNPSPSWHRPYRTTKTSSQMATFELSLTGRIQFDQITSMAACLFSQSVDSYYERVFCRC